MVGASAIRILAFGDNEVHWTRRVNVVLGSFALVHIRMQLITLIAQNLISIFKSSPFKRDIARTLQAWTNKFGTHMFCGIFTHFLDNQGSST